ncbi:MAG: cytochrome c3 family protein [Coriobacteriia bacterium]
MRSRVLVVVALSAVLLFATAASAFGYYYESTSTVITDCSVCHGITAPTTATPTGPHGGYTATSNKCAACHTVHAAPAGGVMLLPAATVKGTCQTCHDGTGGNGVYGVLAARSVVVTASHSIDTTTVIPGGNVSTGGSSVGVFSGVGNTLTCSDCHSPHAASVVATFIGDRARGSVSVTIQTNRLLKQLPTTATTATAVYGSDWCGGCHKGRISGSGAMGNHPVDSKATTSTPFYYENIAKVTGAGVQTTQLGTLGRNNFGYVMPDPRTSDQGAHYPICQQCHEDARNVGDATPQVIAAGEVYSVTATDGVNAANNPRFQVFPHESQNIAFLVETYDDLCLNCHAPD